MKEKDVEGPVCKWAARNNILTQKLLGLNGILDRAFYIPGGKPVLIEFKSPTGKTSALQDYYIDRLEQLGYQVKVVNNAEEAIKYISDRMAS